MVAWANVATAMRRVGQAILAPPAYGGGGGRPGFAAAQTEDHRFSDGTHQGERRRRQTEEIAGFGSTEIHVREEQKDDWHRQQA